MSSGVLIFDDDTDAQVVETLGELETPDLFIVDAARKPVQVILDGSPEDVLIITPGGPPGPAGPEGPAGAEGAAGPTGPQGPAGIGTSYETVQYFASAQTLWVVDHNFGTYAIDVLTFDQNGDLIEGNVRYPSENRIEIDFYYPTAGTARLFR